MSTTPHQNPPHVGEALGSVRSLAFQQPLPRTPDHMACKRVFFYKSGDPQFGGLRVIISGRTFKTFDALLDALSKKVPLPFGVRTITTPRGVHAVRGLEELQDGGSYVCSDQKRIKPLNMDEANRRQVPWNTTRPVSSGRRGILRQLARRTEVSSRIARRAEVAVVVRTPKRLVVFKNKDATVKRIVVLQRRTAPTFEALLDYLSQVMQFHVVKLCTAQGRRIEGLPALIMCSGVVVACGNEPFRLGNFKLQGLLQPNRLGNSESMEITTTQSQSDMKNKSPASSSRSRKFSLSSERYFVNQINKSLSCSLCELASHKAGSLETDINQPEESIGMETSESMTGIAGRNCLILPTEDDIEKSFRVNQDGSMTVEMKVRLTLKQQEMLHWTTTVSRAFLDNCASQSGSGPNTPFCNNDMSRDSMEHCGCESKEEHVCTPDDKSVAFKSKGESYCRSATSETTEKPKSSFRRTPTPGPRHVKSNQTTVEKIKKISKTEIQESTVGTYSYMEHTGEGEVNKGYCVVSRSSTTSTRPVPKPRKAGSAEAKCNETPSSLRASRVAEVLQIQNSGHGLSETMLHIYETQGNCNSHYSNSLNSLEKSPAYGNSPLQHTKGGSTDSGPCSSHNDCDVDLTRPSTTSESLNGKKEDILSLSSVHTSPQQNHRNNLSSCTDNETRLPDMKSGGKQPDSIKKKRTLKSVEKKNISPLSSSSETRKKDKIKNSLKDIKKIKSPETPSHFGSDKKTISSGESKKSHKHVNPGRKKNGEGNDDSLLKSPKLNTENEKGSVPSKQLHLDVATINNSPDTETSKPHLTKNILSVSMPHFQGPIKKLTAKQKSMTENRLGPPNQDLSESTSKPLLQCPSSNVHQYVENWLQHVEPESVPYMEETCPKEAKTEKMATFHIGSDSQEESEESGAFRKVSGEEESPSSGDKTEERSESHPPVQITCEGEPVDDRPQKMRGFCKSMPSVRIHLVDQDSRRKMHKSSEAIFPADHQASDDSRPNMKAGMNPVLEQLCLSIQSIRRASSPTRPLSLEKTRSLPDFSTQVASAFGSSSKALLSFLSVMTLKDNSFNKKVDQSFTGNSCPEALQVMQSLEKISNIEDQEELRASLTDLQRSSFSKFEQSWKDFQERNNVDESPQPSPKDSEQEFALDLDSEDEGVNNDQSFGIKQLMEELSMSEELRNEISSLVESELNSHDIENVPSDICDDLGKLQTKHNVTQPPGGSPVLDGSYIEKQNNDKNTSLTKEMEQIATPETMSELQIDKDISSHCLLISEHGVKEQDNKDSEIKAYSAGNDVQDFKNLENQHDYGVPNHKAENDEHAIVSETSNNKSMEEGNNINCQSKDAETENSCVEKQGYQEKEVTDGNSGISETVDVEAQCCNLGGSATAKSARVVSDDQHSEAQTEDDKDGCKHLISEQSDTEDMDSERFLTPVSENESMNSDIEKAVILPFNILKGSYHVDSHCCTPFSESKDLNEEHLCNDQDFSTSNGLQLAEQLNSCCKEQDGIESENDQQEDLHCKVSECEDEENNSPHRSVSEEDTEDLLRPTSNLSENQGFEKESLEPQSHGEKSNSSAEEPDINEEAYGDQSDVELENADVESESIHNSLPETVDIQDSMHRKPDFSQNEESDIEHESHVSEEGPLKESSISAAEEQEIMEDNEQVESADNESDTADISAESLQDSMPEEDECSVMNNSHSYQSQDSDEPQEIPQGIHLKEDNQIAREHTVSETAETEDEIIHNSIPESDNERPSRKESSLSQDQETDMENEPQESEKSSERSMSSAEHAHQRDDNESSVTADVDAESVNDSALYPKESIEQESDMSQSQDSDVEAEESCDEEPPTPTEAADRMEEEAEEKVDTMLTVSATVEAEIPPQSFPASGADIKHFYQDNSESYQEHNTDNEKEIEREDMQTDGPEMYFQHNLQHHAEISQEMLDLINSALLSSTLTLKYDTNGNFRIVEHEPGQIRLREMLKKNLDGQYGQKRLPSPNTSDLSDYRHDTSDSGGYKSQDSWDVSTDTGEENGAASHDHGIQYKKTQNQTNSLDLTEDGALKSPLGSITKVRESRDLNSVDSLNSKQDLACVNTSSSHGDSESVHCLALYSQADLREGVLIDKGRWLLKENHLIRKSPPISTGMYDNADTTSADTGQDNRSDIASFSHFGNQQSPMAVISSSELEEMAKPPTPKCKYFNMPHSSDSDPFQDDKSNNGSRHGENTRKSREFRVSPLGEPIRTWVRKNGSHSSFASVEFKIPDGKIHPEDGPAATSAGVEQSKLSQSSGGRTLQEEDCTETLRLRCGQHCPIL